MDIIMVLIYVFNALLLHRRYSLGVAHKCFELAENALEVWLHIDNRAQRVFVEYAIIFGFATAHTDNSIVHGLQGIHARNVAIELVENHIAVLHHLAILGKRHALGYDELYALGIFSLKGLCCLEHDVGALIFATPFADANEYF